jgi:hypothetical protein
MLPECLNQPRRERVQLEKEEEKSKIEKHRLPMNLPVRFVQTLF